jgi:HlyD family secretion protein
MTPSDGRKQYSPETQKPKLPKSTQRMTGKEKQPLTRLKTQIWWKKLLFSSRIIIWTVVGVATLSLGWVVTTQIDIKTTRVISTTGQFTTREKIKEMQAPENKVVREVFVKEGEKVKKGKPLITFDSINSYEKLKVLETQRQSLVQQNEFYSLLANKPANMAQVEGAILRLKLPREAAFLARNRTALIVANQQYQAQANESAIAPNNAQSSVSSPKGNKPVNVQKKLVEIALQQMQQQLAQNHLQQEEVKENIAQIQQKLDKIAPLVSEGALAQIKYSEQEEAWRSSQDELARLKSQQQQLQLNLQQVKEQLKNTSTGNPNANAKTVVDYQKQIADNKKQIVEIDSQLTKIISDNETQIAQLDRQIELIKPSVNAYVLKAPDDGTVFQLRAIPGFGTQSDRNKTLLKFNSGDRDLAIEVLLPKEDFALVQEGTIASIQFDTPPLRSLGKLQAKVISVGSDALPPDAIHHYYGVPTKIVLDRQVLKNERVKKSLRVGVSATVAIAVNQKQSLAQIVWQKISPLQ